MPLFNPETKPTIPQETVPEVQEPIVPEVEENTNIPDVSFIVEDGSIVPSANSYCDLDYADEYAANKGYQNWLQLDDNEKKINLIIGTEFVNNYFDWKGVRKSQNQSLAFPRGNIFDNDGYAVLGIPENLKKACIEAAVIGVNNASDTLFSVDDETGRIKKQKVDVLEVEYFDESESRTSHNQQGDPYVSIYGILNYLLKGLYKTGNDNGSAVCTKAMWEY